MECNMLRPKTTLLTLALAIGFLAGGCASIQQTLSSEQFDLRSKYFVRAIRWGEIDKLPAFFAPGAELPDFAPLEEIKVTDAEAGPWKVTTDGMHITQSLSLKYYRTDTLVERSLTSDQLWRYDPERHAWFLESGFPQFSPAK
jgi:hypothetical protein